MNDIEVGRANTRLNCRHFIFAVFIRQNEGFAIDSADTCDKTRFAGQCRSDQGVGKVDLIWISVVDFVFAVFQFINMDAVSMERFDRHDLFVSIAIDIGQGNFGNIAL